MMNMKNSRTKRIIAGILAGLIVLAMIVPMIMYAF